MGTGLVAWAAPLSHGETVTTSPGAASGPRIGAGRAEDVDGLMSMYVEARRHRWTGQTRRTVDWALFVLWREHQDRLPRDPGVLLQTIRRTALSDNSRRVVYGVWRTFYGWLGEQDPSIPDLPHVFFSTRRQGEKRGGLRPWQRR